MGLKILVNLYTDYFRLREPGFCRLNIKGFPDVGEIPYGCVWAARGTLDQLALE